MEYWKNFQQRTGIVDIFSQNRSYTTYTTG